MGVLNKPIKKKSQGLLTRMLLASLMCVSAVTIVRADETDAKKMLKGMSDYVASQKAISFDYDAAWSRVQDTGLIARMIEGVSAIIGHVAIITGLLLQRCARILAGPQGVVMP